MKCCNNHLNLLITVNNVTEIQQKEREAQTDTNRQDCNGLHLANLNLRSFLLGIILFVI